MDFVEIGSLLSGGKHFIIPDNQREYSWERLQNQTLWQDLLDLMEQGKAFSWGACYIRIRFPGYGACGS